MQRANDLLYASQTQPSASGQTVAKGLADLFGRRPEAALQGHSERNGCCYYLYSSTVEDLLTGPFLCRRVDICTERPGALTRIFGTQTWS